MSEVVHETCGCGAEFVGSGVQAVLFRRAHDACRGAGPAVWKWRPADHEIPPPNTVGGGS